MSKKMLFLLLLITPLFSLASPLQQQLTQFFRQREPQYAGQMQAVIITPRQGWPVCSRPVFSLPGNSRRWGKMTVAARCGPRKNFLQTELQVTGNYYVAAQQIPRGSLVTQQLLSRCYGRLDTLPARSLLVPSQTLPAIALQTLQPGKVIIRTQLRQPWQVTSGDQVQVSLYGNGFSVGTAGTALNNATAGNEVRVRTLNGQIIIATVDSHGLLSVKIN